MRVAAAVCLLAFASSPAGAQTEALRELSTDRPDKTESAYTVPAGRVQIELDVLTYTVDRDDGVRTDTVGLAPFNLKFGVARRADLQFIVEPYFRRTVTDRATGARSRTAGVGDVTVRFKRNLWGDDGGPTALALMPFVKLPTNNGGVGNDAIEFGLIVPLALSLSEGVGIGLMTEIDILRQAEGRGYAPSFVNSATVAFDLSDRLGVYTELFTERSTERGARWVVTGDLGLTFALTPELQLDAGANIGLTDAADDLALFAGISRRF